MSEVSAFEKSLNKLYLKQSYEEAVELIKKELSLNLESSVERKLDFAMQRHPIATLFVIAGDELNTPWEKRLNWLSDWAVISPEIAHKKFYNDIVPRMIDTDELINFIIVYQNHILPELTSIKDCYSLSNKFENLVKEQVYAKETRSSLLLSISRNYMRLEEYEHANKLILENIDLFDITSIWSELYEVSLKTENKNNLIQTIASINAYISKIEKQNKELASLNEPVKRFISESIELFKDDLQEDQNIRETYLKAPFLPREKRLEVEKVLKSRSGNLKKEYTKKYSNVIDLNDTTMLIGAFKELSKLDLLRGSINKKGVALSKLISLHNTPINDTQQFKKAVSLLETKLLSLYIKDMRVRFMEKTENIDKNSAQYEHLLLELTNDINEQAKIAYQKQLHNSHQQHVVERIKKVSESIKEIFKEANIEYILKREQEIFDQLIIGETTFRNLNDIYELSHGKKKANVSTIDYSPAAIAFTKALEYALVKYFVYEFNSYCQENEISTPQQVKDIVNPEKKNNLLTLGRFSYLLASPDYKEAAQKYFRYRFKNQHIIHNYKTFQPKDKKDPKVDNSFKFIKDVLCISRLRNIIAHKDPISRNEAVEIRLSVIGASQQELEKYRNSSVKVLIKLFQDLKV